MEESTLCRKCFMKKYKPSKKNADHIVLSNWREECECCGHIDKIVIDIEVQDE